MIPFNPQWQGPDYNFDFGACKPAVAFGHSGCDNIPILLPLPEVPMSRTTRRSFLKSAGGAFLGIQAMTYRGALLAQNKPSETVRVGSIGVGNQGRPNMNAIKKHVVAVCDVDRNRVAAARDLEKASIKAATFGDYRKLLESKDVDAVVISTPDHWHALTVIDACQAGKDVYCEKPLSLVVAEGRAMVKAARSNKRIVQTGSQQRSAKEFRQACELVRNGALGAIKQVKVGLPGPNWVRPRQEAGPRLRSAGRARLRILARPGPERQVQREPRPLPLPLLLGLLGRPADQLRRRTTSTSPSGVSAWTTAGPITIEGTATFNAEPAGSRRPRRPRQTFTYANGVKVLCSLGERRLSWRRNIRGREGHDLTSSGVRSASL